MSIQRYGPRGGDILTAQSTGQYVTYADHLAEVRRVTALLRKLDEATALLADRDEAWQAGVDQEQQRIVDAVEALCNGDDPDSMYLIGSAVLAAIKGDSA